MKLLKILTIFIVVLTLASGLYIQLNLFEGEPYVYQEADMTTELEREIDRADAFYVPF